MMEFMSTGSDNKEELDLLMKHLNVSDVIDIMENLYPAMAGGFFSTETREAHSKGNTQLKQSPQRDFHCRVC